MPTEEQQTEISWEEAVARFLDENPEYFRRNPELLTRLSVPHPQSGQAVSLIERQVAVLRKQNQVLQRRLRELVSNARENDVLGGRLHEFAKAMVSTGDVGTLLDMAEWLVRGKFKLDAVVIRIACDELHDKPRPELVPADDPQLAVLLGRSPEGTPICGGCVDDEVRPYLFGKLAPAIKSMALIPLADDGVRGVLCLGSQDPHRFHEDMATDYLSRLGELLGCGLARYLQPITGS